MSLILAAGADRMANWLAQAHAHDVQWVTNPPGDLPATLIRVAAQCGPSLIVIGVNEDRTAVLAVAASVSAPILAVPTGAVEPPTRLLMALDFSESSVRAARTAVSLLARPGYAVMVSVGARPTPRETLASHEDLLFDAVENTLGVPRDIGITRHRASGETSASLLRLVTAQRMDLISIGRQGRSGRHFKGSTLGSVARTIASTAPCIVLIGAASGALH